MIEPLAAGRLRWAAEHVATHAITELRCQMCGAVYPCPVLLLLDALDAAEAREGALREAIAEAAGFVPAMSVLGRSLDALLGAPLA